jgi:hypothetical protein
LVLDVGAFVRGPARREAEKDSSKCASRGGLVEAKRLRDVAATGLAPAVVSVNLRRNGA